MFPSAPIRLSRVATGLSVLALAFAGMPAFAQITWDVQVPFNLSTLTPALVSPGGIAVAPDGTVYVTDATHATAGRVIMIMSTGVVGTTTPASLTTTSVVTLDLPAGLTVPSAVAVDSLGDLYIADYANKTVWEVTNPETTPNFSQFTHYGGTGPTALATDSSNNLYVADKNGAIYEFAGASASPTTIVAAGSGYTPVGLAVNSAADVIFASGTSTNRDVADNKVYEYMPGHGVSEYPAGTVTFHFSDTVAATPGLPIGMGFDPAGAFYVLDSYSTTGSFGATTNHAYLWQIVADNAFQVPLSAATTQPGSLTVSNIGNLYISDDSSSGGGFGGGAVTPSVAELFYDGNPVNFGTVAAGSTSPPVNVNFYFTTDQSPLTAYETVSGDTSTVFSLTGRCTGNIGICNLALDFSPTNPGIQNGLVGYTNSSNDIYAVHATGNSDAASVALYPGIQSKLSTTLYEPQGIAVSGNGANFFVADEGGINLNTTNPTYPHPAVYVYSATGNVPSGTPTKLTLPTQTGTPSGAYYPDAVTLDGSGNLYVADYEGYVYEFVPTYKNGKNTWSIGSVLLGPTILTHPMSLTVDIHDNLWIGDMGSAGVNATKAQPGYIVKLPLNGGTATKLNYVIGGVPVIFPSGLTTDAYGNLFIADAGDGVTYLGNVDVVPYSTGQATTLSISGNSLTPNTLSEPDAVALDAADDLYVVDSYNERILTIPLKYTNTVPAINGGAAKITLLGALNATATPDSGLSSVYTPTAFVIWPDQNTLTVSDIGGGTAAYPVQVLTLSSLDTPTINIALNSSASLVGINVGSAPVTFGSPTSSNSTYSLGSSSCGNDGMTLDMGATSACTVTVDSSSTSGTGGAGTITLSTGNVINLTGPVTPSVLTFSPTPGNYAPTANYSVTLTNSGGGTIDITGTPTVTGGTITRDGCAKGTTLTGAATCTINFTITVDYNKCIMMGNETICGIGTINITVPNNAGSTNSPTGSIVSYNYLDGYTTAPGGGLIRPDGTPVPNSRGFTLPTHGGSIFNRGGNNSDRGNHSNHPGFNF